MKLSHKNKLRAQGMIAALLLTACAGATGVGAGCNAYAEERLKMPADDVLVQAPLAVVQWINLLDARMTGVCLGR